MMMINSLTRFNSLLHTCCYAEVASLEPPLRRQMMVHPQYTTTLYARLSFPEVLQPEL